MNLAIDLFIETEEMHPFMVNRTKEDDIQANGKGVNVSLVLKMLDFPSTALGFFFCWVHRKVYRRLFTAETNPNRVY
ncbi:hypothetical protein NWO25_18240 [Enterococcus lactis]|nr:hypothetical protein [Enterococcus lactis]